MTSKGESAVFAPFTPIEKCVGKEIRVRTGGDDYTGLLAGVYATNGLPIMVLTPMREGAMEVHIPLLGSVVTIKHDAKGN